MINKILNITHSFGGGTEVYINNLLEIYKFNIDNIIIVEISNNKIYLKIKKNI